MRITDPVVHVAETEYLGWLVVIGWQSVLASGGYLCGIMTEALIQLNHPEYVPQQWHGTLLFWATVVVAVLINTVTSHILPQFEVFILVVHIFGFFAILIPLVLVSWETHLRDPVLM